MARQRGDTPVRLQDRGTVRTIEVHGEIAQSGCTRLSVSWERWDGSGTADLKSVQDDSTAPRPDFELRLGILGLDRGLSWGTASSNSEQCGTLSGTNLDVRVIRAYALLLEQLADRVEVANAADEAYYREHDRTMRRRLHA